MENVGAKVCISPPTTKRIKELGVRFAPDEDCYNCKLYYGHIMALKDKVDYLFIPRLGSDHPYHVGCPKFISLAEVIHSMYPDLPPIIMPYYSQAKAHHGKFRLLFLALQIGFKFTKNPIRILKSLAAAFKAQQQFNKSKVLSLDRFYQWEKGLLCFLPDSLSSSKEHPIKVALAAHRYVIHDSYASLNILSKLKEHRIDVITSEQIPREIIQKQMDKLDYNFYFEYEREILGTILYFLESGTIDGIIHINTFSCGPDSIAGEMAALYAKRNHLKSTTLLQLTFDELSGEAGLNTRIEAFIDMLTRKRKILCQSHFPILEV